jgi:hypothetical protein
MGTAGSGKTYNSNEAIAANALFIQTAATSVLNVTFTM